MKSISRLAVLLAAPTLIPAQAWAAASGAQSIDVLGFQFTPTLGMSEAYDDNFRELDHHRESSWITSVLPGFELKAEDRNSAYRLTYAGESQTYHDDPSASHDNEDVKLESIMEFTSRQRLNLSAEYVKRQDTTSTAVADVNDKYHSETVGGIYSYGGMTAENRIDLGANYSQLRYDNSGTINADEERNTTGLDAQWFHRLGGSTRALVEVRHTNYDYILPNSPRDSVENALLVGATWDATAKTTGKVRVGYAKKDFSENSREDLSSPMWEVGVDWSPLTYSKFSLTTRQAFDEGDDGADALKTLNTELAWAHNWTSRITSTASLGYTQEKYEGQSRTDDITESGLGVSYKPRRWLELGVGYRHRNDQSDAVDQSFQRNIYLFSMTGSL